MKKFKIALSHIDFIRLPVNILKSYFIHQRKLSAGVIDVPCITYEYFQKITLFKDIKWHS
jgi:hypothetical protein